MNCIFSHQPNFTKYLEEFHILQESIAKNIHICLSLPFPRDTILMYVIRNLILYGDVFLCVCKPIV